MATNARLILNDPRALALRMQVLRFISYGHWQQIGTNGLRFLRATFATLHRAADKVLDGLFTHNRWSSRRLAPLVIAVVLWGTTVPTRTPEIAPPLSPESTEAARSAPPSATYTPKPTESTASVSPPLLPVKLTPDTEADTAALAYWRGRQLTQDSKFAEAVKQLAEAERLTPTFAMAFNARGYANIRLKRYSEALCDLDQALELNPHYANAYQNRSVARRHLGEKAGADADLAKAKELLPALGRSSISGTNRAIVSIWPMEGRVTSGFGRRIDPFSGEGAFHYGVDIDAETGDAVRSTADGIVIHAGGDTGGYGRLVVVDHGNSMQTWYAHLARINVTVGQDVHRGQVIGAAGSSGRATAPHLHYEVRIAGLPRDPYLYLSRQGRRVPGQVESSSRAR